MRLILTLALIWTLPLLADIGPDVDRAISAAGLDRAVWSIRVENEEGEVLYDRNGRNLVVPASARKLFTAFAVAECRGFSGTIVTPVLIDGPVVDGVLHGNLILKGAGDPSFVARYWPDRKEALEPLAAALRAAGVRSIRGAVVADDSRFDDHRFPIGWKHSNLGESYAPPIESLAYNENVAGVFVRGGDCSESLIWTDPHFIDIRDRTRCGAGRLELDFTAENDLTVDGSAIQLTRWTTRLPSVQRASLYAAQGIDDFLRDAGFEILLDPFVVKEPIEGRTLMVFESPSMHTLLGTMIEESSNLFAEMLLKGLAPSDLATYTSALETERRILEDVAVLDPHSFSFSDGSGLSVEDWVAGEAIVRLVRAMYYSEDRAIWKELLPTPGEGTLRRRLGSLEDRLWAKTGSLNGVRALSGWLLTERGETRFFAVVVNNAVPSSAATDTIDRIVRIIARDRR